MMSPLGHTGEHRERAGRGGRRVAAWLVCTLAALSTLPAVAAAQTGTLLKPTVTGVGVPAGWVGGANVPIVVQAHGSLLGVRSIELSAPAQAPPSTRTFPCLPTHVAVCPGDWSQSFSVAASALPEGPSSVVAVAADPLGVRSAPVAQTVRVDRSAPQLDVPSDLPGSGGCPIARTPCSVRTRRLGHAAARGRPQRRAARGRCPPRLRRAGLRRRQLRDGPYVSRLDAAPSTKACTRCGSSRSIRSATAPNAREASASTAAHRSGAGCPSVKNRTAVGRCSPRCTSTRTSPPRAGRIGA